MEDILEKLAKRFRFRPEDFCEKHDMPELTRSELKPYYSEEEAKIVFAFCSPLCYFQPRGFQRVLCA
jgi:hypothetical protein